MIVSSLQLTRLAVPRRSPVLCAAQSAMTDSRRQPRRQNVDGDFFVDHTCIDCGTCRWMSASVFTRQGDQSAVTQQPRNGAERRASLQALLACPTYSIHVNKLEKGELREVHASFPMPLPQSKDLFYNGFTDEKSFAASSYFIRRPEGNVLVDVPRYNPTLVKRFDEMGGVRYIFLTHIDDVGDHAKWAKRYGAKRIIHSAEVNHGTRECEIQLKGEGPWVVGDDGNAAEMELIHTPGHTRGSVCLWHKASRTMFTGDHFAYSGITEGLSVFPRYNDHSVAVQLESVRKLLNYDFVFVCPGHGQSVTFENLEDRDAQILAFLDSQKK